MYIIYSIHIIFMRVYLISCTPLANQSSLPTTSYISCAGVSFVMDENFTFGGLLALKLHEFEDDVMEIVDKAQKELTIEKQLAKITETWKVQNLTFDPMPDNPEMALLKVEETVMECLEDSVVQLGNLQGSKYVQNNPSFLEIVGGWQRKIGNVDRYGSCIGSIIDRLTYDCYI